MKLVILADTHFGIRSDNPVFLKNTEKFFRNTFFPYLEENSIDNILHLGDLFDRRMHINVSTAHKARQFFLDMLKSHKISMDIIIGNHDIYYTNTLEINSLKMLLENYDNINVINKPTEMKYGNEQILLIPWIIKENYDEVMESINNSSSKIVAGHFEIAGSIMQKGIKNKTGLAREIFKKFESVWSGHFHIRSKENNIHYLGSPYEMDWGDFGNKKGFHVFDSEDGSIEFIENPYTNYKQIKYNDMEFDALSDYHIEDVEDKFVKLEVINKENAVLFEQLVKEIHEKKPYRIDVIDRIEIENVNNDSFEETEDNMTLFSQYIDQIDTREIPKDDVKSLLKELYKEAQEI